ncbi:hypothetical protein Tco_0057388, partial [Tanacetum coccineum]
MLSPNLAKDSSMVGGVDGLDDGGGVYEDTSELKEAVNFNYKDLQMATNNFSEGNILGKG